MIIIGIHKKGDTKVCSNYRGITFLCTTYKVYERILENKLCVHSVQDDIFTVQQVIKKKD